MNKEILVIDNYDSFVHNLARYIGLLGFKRRVVRNDAITLEEIKQLNPQAIVISPGPCTPNEAGISLDIIKTFYATYPILGVCLGHQAIAAAFGGNIIHARQPMHGMNSDVRHCGSRIFTGIKSPVKVARYHSLIACEKTLPACLQVLAYCEDKQIMALAHETYPVIGVQFHPESIITSHSFDLLNNFFTEAAGFYRQQACA